MFSPCTPVATPLPAVDLAHAPKHLTREPIAATLPVAAAVETVGVHPRRRDSGRKIVQPVEVALVPDALLQYQTVAALAGLSIREVQRKVRAGEMGDLVHIGPRCVRLRARDVVKWLAAQGAPSPQSAGHPPPAPGDDSGSVAAAAEVPASTPPRGIAAESDSR